MPGSLTHDVLKGPPPPPEEHGWRGGGGDGSDERGASRRASFTGLFVLLAASTMVFAAFTSAFVVRRGLSDDWASMPKPPILFVNTAVLLASSFALEVARRALKAGVRAKFNSWWNAGTALGVLFLLGQLLAWRETETLQKQALRVKVGRSGSGGDFIAPGELPDDARVLEVREHAQVTNGAGLTDSDPALHGLLHSKNRSEQAG